MVERPAYTRRSFGFGSYSFRLFLTNVLITVNPWCCEWILLTMRISFKEEAKLAGELASPGTKQKYGRHFNKSHSISNGLYAAKKEMMMANQNASA